ncbi:hypothetical protein RND81_07G083100 [Saponaria officinalis]|uniref:F-box domain-containing protein n=1 Tax=Saponaria officinalis TaxID=3572 RepID=A0AAW1JQE3_SAPOF
MAFLPMDIILSCILPKLPAKSLIRFRCVCKSFLAEISSPKFVKLHHHNALYSDSNRLLIFKNDSQGIYVYNLNSPHSPPSLIRFPKITLYSHQISIVATCECYLLIGYEDNYHDSLFLLNPSTRMYRELPRIPCNSQVVLYGMCHRLDEFNDEYKVVRFVDFEGIDGCELEVMVYNTTTNLWKLIESKTVVDTFISCYDNNPVLVQNHLLHLLFFDFDHGLGLDHIKRIGCFDMKAERWANDVQLPDILWDENGLDLSLGRPYNLGALDDQLCFMGHYVNGSNFDFWVMKEYGVKESWVKLMSFCVSNDLDSERLYDESYHPLAYRTGSPYELLYMHDRCNCKFYWYNLRDKEAIEAEFARIFDYEFWSDFLGYICKGSILDFPGGQLIKVSLEEDDDDEEENENDDENFIS